jgi:hypothetical protein
MSDLSSITAVAEGVWARWLRSTSPCHQPCLLGDRHPPLPSQNMPEMAPQTPLPALSTFATLSGAQMTPVLTCYSRECAAQPEPWKSSVTFGRRGTPIFIPLSSFFFIPFHRAAIEEDYAKRLAKLAKLTLGRDEIGYVSSGPGLDDHGLY